jgi:stalled ribosome alternative rescue factor ArfA
MDVEDRNQEFVSIENLDVSSSFFDFVKEEPNNKKKNSRTKEKKPIDEKKLLLALERYIRIVGETVMWICNYSQIPCEKAYICGTNVFSCAASAVSFYCSQPNVSVEQLQTRLEQIARDHGCKVGDLVLLPNDAVIKCRSNIEEAVASCDKDYSKLYKPSLPCYKDAGSIYEKIKKIKEEKKLENRFGKSVRSVLHIYQIEPESEVATYFQVLSDGTIVPEEGVEESREETNDLFTVLNVPLAKAKPTDKKKIAIVMPFASDDEEQDEVTNVVLKKFGLDTTGRQLIISPCHLDIIKTKGQVKDEERKLQEIEKKPPKIKDTDVVDEKVKSLNALTAVLGEDIVRSRVEKSLLSKKKTSQTSSKKRKLEW